MDTLYSLLDPLVIPLTWLLEMIHTTLGVSWGWSIVVLTVLVRIAMIPLTVKQQQSFRSMQALQPEIKKLQAKYKDNRQKLNEETMLFYKENKVNPFGSCLPLLVQLPIFFALYVLLVDLSQEIQRGDDRSMLWNWIPSITESLNSLPATTLYPLMILYVVSQMGSTILMPTSVDPKQKYIFIFLPVVFAYFIVNPPFVVGAAIFPAGLLVYWITTNLWTCGQAAVIRVWFPPPLPPSAQVEGAAAGKKPSGGLMARLGFGGAPSTQMPKAKKPKSKPPLSQSPLGETESEAKAPPPPPKNRGQRQKRPTKRSNKPARGGPKGS